MAMIGQANGNATKAAKLAGYSDSSYGRELRTKPHVIESIEAYREHLMQSGEYRVIDPIRIHKEWITLLDDNETTNTEKITLLRDAARSNAMFTDKVEHSGNLGGQIVISSGDVPPDKWEEIAKSHMESMLKVVSQFKERADAATS